MTKVTMGRDVAGQSNNTKYLLRKNSSGILSRNFVGHASLTVWDVF